MTSPASAITPDVSVVVIAYNERDHAPECVRAIFGQRTDARFDVVFVDDGSTDGTADAVAAAVGGDVRFRLVRLPHNRGRGAARAAGVEAAGGRAIGFVDADITLPPDWLARCLAELPGHAAVGGIAVPDGDTTVLARFSGATPREVAGSMPITGVAEASDGPDVGVGVGPRRGAGLSTGPSPRPALRTGRATLAASGSPRVQIAGVGDPAAALAQGVGIVLPR
jgi:glycosyltransferase involved in cell wall biosynthesis